MMSECEDCGETIINWDSKATKCHICEDDITNEENADEIEVANEEDMMDFD